MSKRNQRRHQKQKAAHRASRTPAQHDAAGGRLLLECQARARRRANKLSAGRVWKLAAEYRTKANEQDPTGALAADIDRTCAEAFAAVAGRHLVRGSLPAADRIRHER
jgi:hypothetical protein